MRGWRSSRSRSDEEPRCMSGNEYDRRRFLSAGAAALGAVGLGAAGTGREVTVTRAGPAPSFGSINQIDAGVLNVGYAEDGPADGPPVLLLHGWPYDIHSFVDVVPLLTAKGYRVVVPHLRGYGSTRVLANDAVRNGP